MASTGTMTNDGLCPTSPSVPSSSEVDSSLVNRLMGFISEASDVTIGATLVAISAILYVVLGRIGLIIIGLVCGVFLHAGWEQSSSDHRRIFDLRKGGRETSSEAIQRLLERRGNTSDFTKNQDDHVKANIALSLATGEDINFDAFHPEISKALNELVEAVAINYVDYWYSPIIPTETNFPRISRRMLAAFVLALGNHQLYRRPADVFLTFLTNSTSIFIVFLSELSAALKAEAAFDLSIQEAIHEYLSNAPDSNLGSIVDQKEQEKRLLAISDEFLQAFLDHKMYNCQPVFVFLREIMARVVLGSVVKFISDPYWINSWIVYLLEEGEPELLNVIDAGVEHATSSSAPTNLTTERTLNANAFISGETGKPDTAKLLDLDRPASIESTRSNDAMQAAIEEAKRLTRMIQEQESVANLSEHGSNRVVSSNAPDAVMVLDATKANNTVSAPDAVTTTSSHEVISGSSLVSDTIDSKINNSDDENSALDQEKSFTSFDQIVPQWQPIPEPTKVVPLLTLHRAKITILDDAQPEDKSPLKVKSHLEYLIQVEPASSVHSGWMVARTYTELESLHEYLYTIANVSGVPSFTRRYQVLPPFKGKLKSDLRASLEVFLQFALSHETLSESEGMRKFLDRDQGFRKANSNRGSLKFVSPVGDAFQTVGKGVLGGFNTATKGVAAGGQAVFGGVGGLFNTPKKSTSQASSQIIHSPINTKEDGASSESVGSSTLGNPHKHSSINPVDQPPSVTGASFESLGKLNNTQVAPVTSSSEDAQEDLAASGSPHDKVSEDQGGLKILSKVKDETTLSAGRTRLSDDTLTKDSGQPLHLQNEGESEVISKDRISHDLLDSDVLSNDQKAPMRSPMDEQETKIALELIFAAINELFTLSSAWNIRRTLLNAAKNYLLRPGNPSLLSIRDLLRSTLDDNLDPLRIATNIRKIRENGVPTEEEIANWPPDPSEDEKTALCARARKLFLQHGLPQALNSVMGAAASREALARVFDALQIEDVSRGLMTALLLQTLKTIVH